MLFAIAIICALSLLLDMEQYSPTGVQEHKKAKMGGLCFF
jgi:hypothetical protein